MVAYTGILCRKPRIPRLLPIAVDILFPSIFVEHTALSVPSRIRQAMTL
jgi:hypothetical protein